MSVLTMGILYVFFMIICLVVPISADVPAVCNLQCPKKQNLTEGLQKTLEGSDSLCEQVQKDCKLNVLGTKIESAYFATLGVCYILKACFGKKDDSDPKCQNIVDRFKQTEFLSTPEGTAIAKPPTCDESNPDDGCELNIPRQKRGNPDFHWKYVWHQDKIRKRKQCCMTTKRVVHFVKSCGKNCYPVYCPLAGGYQFTDEVVCNIKSKKQQRMYQARHLSQPNAGPCKLKRGKKCRTAYTLRTYLVTNVPPQGWWGHCLYDWVPVWFTPLAVPTHCYCEFLL